MSTLEEALARQADPAMLSEAAERTALIDLRIDRRAQQRAADQARKAKSVTAKIYHLHDLAKELAKAATGITPCKAGCHHCCNMATLVSLPEAKLIAKTTGMKMHMPARFNQFDRYLEDFEGKPCPMLKDGRCSIYEQRPFACRIHYSVDRDNLLCQIRPGHTIRSPSINVDGYEREYVNTVGNGAAHLMQYADIREYFGGAA